MRKKQIGILGATAIAMATVLSGGVQVNAAQTTETVRHQENKEGLNKEKKPVVPVSVRNRHGGFSGEQNPYKHIRRGTMNQRQWRKWRRSNPNA